MARKKLRQPPAIPLSESDVTSQSPPLAPLDDHDRIDFMGNREAEMALVNLILTNPAESQRLLAALQPRDFFWGDTQWLFVELRSCAAENDGHVTDDAVLQGWFGSPSCKQRLIDAGLDHWKAGDEPSPAYLLLTVGQKGDFANHANAAHADWYIRELRKFRRSRGIRVLLYDVMTKLNETPERPDAVLEFLETQLQKIKLVV